MTRQIVMLPRDGATLIGVQTPRGAYEVIDDGAPRTIRSSRRVVAIHTTLRAESAAAACSLAERLRDGFGPDLLETLWSLCERQTQTVAALLNLLGDETTLAEDELRLALAADEERFVVDLSGVQPRSAEARAARAEREAAERTAQQAIARWRERLQAWRAGQPVRVADAAGAAQAEAAGVEQALRAVLLGAPTDDALRVALRNLGTAGDGDIAGQADAGAAMPHDLATREAAGELLVERGLLDGIGDIALATTTLATDEPVSHALNTPALATGAADDRGWWTIDGEGAEELDDAIWARREGDDVLLAIAIAAPGLFIDHDSAADRQARARGSTLYHPRRTSGIWPPQLATDAASLIAGTRRPALVAELRIGPDGRWTSELSARRVAIARAWTYAAFDEALTSPPTATNDRTHAQVEALGEAAIRIRQGRLQAGGWAAMQPQTDVRARQQPGEVQLRDTSPYHPARAVVGEAMLAAGMAFAAYAEKAGIAVPWRVQRWLRAAPTPPGRRLHDPAGVSALLGQVERTEVGFEPGPHALIGAPGYVQATSPLRRYGDVLVHRRLLAQLRGEADPLDDATMQIALRESEQAGRERTRFGRQAARAYKLAWFARALAGRPARRSLVYGQVTRLRDAGRVDIALPGLGLTTRCTLAEPAEPGDWWAMACLDIAPSRGRLVVAPRHRVAAPTLGPGVPLDAARWVPVAPPDAGG